MAATSGTLSEIGTASARSSFQLFLGHSSSTVIMAVTAVVVGRLLGPENYGIYTLTLTIPALLSLVSDLGISSALVRFTAKTNSDHGPEEAARIARIGVLFKVIVSIFISFSVFLFARARSMDGV
jgi:O-antigen/teichoic acid export membrane protein